MDKTLETLCLQFANERLRKAGSWPSCVINNGIRVSTTTPAILIQQPLQFTPQSACLYSTNVATLRALPPQIYPSPFRNFDFSRQCNRLLFARRTRRCNVQGLQSIGWIIGRKIFFLLLFGYRWREKGGLHWDWEQWGGWKSAVGESVYEEKRS